MMKYKINANGIIIHPKHGKAGALTTSANTAMHTAQNSPRFMKNSVYTRAKPQATETSSHRKTTLHNSPVNSHGMSHG